MQYAKGEYMLILDDSGYDRVRHRELLQLAGEIRLGEELRKQLRQARGKRRAASHARIARLPLRSLISSLFFGRTLGRPRQE